MDLPVKEIETDINTFQKEGKTLCITSSFQTHSLPLLHIITRIIPDIPVLFIDTGFHFPETYQFRDEISKDWKLNLINVKSKIPKNQQRDETGHFLYTGNPEYCCHINKTVPLNDEVVKYDVWVAGLRRDQTAFRKNLEKNVIQKDGRIKYHPILEWNSKMIYEYSKKYDLPAHPLEKQGYFSIGCMPCTAPPMADAKRSGRWYGMRKTECGIHLDTK